MESLLFEMELPLSRVLAEMELHGVRGGPGPAFGSGRGVEGAGGVADAADLRAGGNRIQHQFPQAAGGNPVRQAGAARAEKDQDRLFHQRRRAGEAGAPARNCREDPSLPADHEADLHLRGGPAQGDRSRIRKDPHPFQSDDHGDGKAQQHGTEPAEYPDPAGGRPPDPTGVRPVGAGLANPFRRLFPDRTAGFGPPFRRRIPEAGVFRRIWTSTRRRRWMCSACRRTR